MTAPAPHESEVLASVDRHCDTHELTGEQFREHVKRGSCVVCDGVVAGAGGLLAAKDAEIQRLRAELDEATLR